MKRIAIAACLAIAAPSVAQQPPSSPAPGTTPSPCVGHAVLRNVDRFTGVTTLKTTFTPTWDRLTPNILAFTHEGKTAFAIVVSALTEDKMRYGRCATVFILADDKPVAATVTRAIQGDGSIEAASKAAQEKMITDGLTEGKSHPRLHLLAHVFFSETVMAQIDADGVAALSTANKIEIKVCNDEFATLPSFVAAAHELACRAQPPS
jgi:hypothetical protein